ncbi:MAG: septum formation initiator family protein [Candidatus Omnitrophica bacterium]|nr:septum formation initiator family protein [Candidatus Omnitrophota bacterium]
MLATLKRTFGVFGTIVLLLVIFLPGFTKLQELKDKNRDLEAKIRRLNMENVLLQEELKKAENDPLYQERVLRDKMGVVRKGEIPVRLVPEKKR